MKGFRQRVVSIPLPSSQCFSLSSGRRGAGISKKRVGLFFTYANRLSMNSCRERRMEINLQRSGIRRRMVRLRVEDLPRISSRPRTPHIIPRTLLRHRSMMRETGRLRHQIRLLLPVYTWALPITVYRAWSTLQLPGSFMGHNRRTWEEVK
jgi:hypothetical protein